jgi:uncharacterized protein (TIGR03435 family)
MLGPAHPARTQAQSTPQNVAPTKFEYDVATVKPTKSPEGGWGLWDTRDGLTGKNVPLLYVIQSAYGVYEQDRILGAPNWAGSETYDIAAKMDPAVADAFQKLNSHDRELAYQHMLQSLLADRFSLVAHRETKDLPVYFLAVAKNGPKLQDAKPDSSGANNPHMGGTVRPDGTVKTEAHQMTMDVLAGSLSRPSGRTVLDKTGLTRKYEFTLEYAQDGAPQDSSIPTLFTALQEQLGLKLEPGRGPVEVIVIDHVERPSGN